MPFFEMLGRSSESFTNFSLHSQTDKISFVGPHDRLKILGQKAKATIKGTPRATNEIVKMEVTLINLRTGFE